MYEGNVIVNICHVSVVQEDTHSNIADGCRQHAGKLDNMPSLTCDMTSVAIPRHTMCHALCLI